MIKTLAHGHRYDGGRAAGELGLDYTDPAPFMDRLIGWFRDEGLTAR